MTAVQPFSKEHYIHLEEKQLTNYGYADVNIWQAFQK
jgi:hypothetical protein